jgi:hypothetical protein
MSPHNSYLQQTSVCKLIRKPISDIGINLPSNKKPRARLPRAKIGEGGASELEAQTDGRIDG